MQSKSSSMFRAPSVQHLRSSMDEDLEFEPQHPWDKAKYGGTRLQSAGEAETRGLWSCPYKMVGPRFRDCLKKTKEELKR